MAGGRIRMKQTLLASVSVVALTVAAAAADLPTAPSRMPYKAPIAAPARTWTGFYLGVNGGVLWHRAKTDIVDQIGDTTSSTVNASGATFGGQVGYNWQYQAWVFGVEGDWNWVNSSGTGTFPTFAPNFIFSSKISSLATGRGRIGYAMGAAGDWLPYVTGGVAAGKVNNFIPALFGGYQDNKTKVGWTAGGGIEHMFDPHWSAKVEALYVDLGSSTVQGFFGAGYSGRFNNTAVIARAGVNYKW